MARPKTIKIILAIESSCDETSCALINNNFKILSNVTYSQIPLHQKTNGVVPEVASREHSVKIIPTIKNALRTAQRTLKDIDAIAVTAGPGLIGSLLVGVETAKALAWALDLPIIPVNHIYGHLVSPLANAKINIQKIKFPILALTASGGHTQLVLIKNWLNYKTVGQTVDDAAGETYDKIATLLGLPYPGGPVLEKLARSFSDKTKIVFPSPKLTDTDFDFSFSGLKTAVLYFLRNHPNANLSEIAFSSQQAIVKALTEKTFRAFLKFQPKTVFITGGVAANQVLQKAVKNRFTKLCPIYFPPPGFLGDNGGMIAIAGQILAKNNQIKKWSEVKANPNLTL
ncbi:MAG: O-sialoglycoprotein endopeptidase [Candidatus Berkelbacteria bacterium Licking1014_7]|uniref:tRNA N6-adenosine threonylcarbamoyltransferase n=1 Tax=Candidatus Berkelbacteria bacterium Licking1014_7 TaxID=2017147 RepID=A0A554LK77_9BACT|nr:MAG: O-sialoglycoprotein endopeptidase [Candidatus Berkelbacteria bacterium Licking1014_7]